jgi:prolyl-tRNA synthetase
MTRTAITPKRKDDFSKWYLEAIKELVANSPVRGSMVFKPWGISVWEMIKNNLDKRFKRHDVENAYFPLLIPISFLEKEAKHIDGFAKECAVVTHHRLIQTDDGLQPDGKLEEPFVIRPTSETIIGDVVKDWIHSYRDLPMKLNQWANIMRWEMKTKPFLRTSEILWQEGHTFHETASEASNFAVSMLHEYESLMRDSLCLDPILGIKVRSETFPGAEETYTTECLLQDLKVLQNGTSHFLGQKFTKGFDITYLKDNSHKHAWSTSWGVTTRLIGAMVMTHGDDDGLRLPPSITPYHVVIIPVIKGDQSEEVVQYCHAIKDSLEKLYFNDQPIRITIDMKNETPQEKKWKWVRRGVPIRLEIGKRDMLNNSLCLQFRSEETSKKHFLPINEAAAEIQKNLVELQSYLQMQSRHLNQNNTYNVKSIDEFNTAISNGVGLILATIADDDDIWNKIKTEHKFTPRCIKLDDITNWGECIFTGKKGRPTLLGKAY